MAEKKPATEKELRSKERSSKAVDAARHRLEGTYERLRHALQQGPDDGRLDRPLSYWVLPTDRRLPLAFLDRSIRNLVNESLESLMRTPGVGQMKILGLFDLLRRVIKAETLSSPFDKPTPGGSTGDATGRVDPSEASEAVWSRWCEAVLHAGFGDHKLGRVAPTLRVLPTVIWDTPMSEYASRPLSEIRSMKTHGEKRVNAILQVFGAVYEAVSAAALHEDLQLDLMPRFAPKLTRWLTTPRESLACVEVREQIAMPLIAQIDRDLGPSIAELVRERLALSGPAPTVIVQARRLRVTRARVYQLLEDCGRVMAVRWPEGRWLLAGLTERVESDDEAAGLIQRVLTLFFPE